MWKPLNLEIVRYLMFHDQVIEKGSYCNIITSMKDMATGNVWWFKDGEGRDVGGKQNYPTSSCRIQDPFFSPVV